MIRYLLAAVCAVGFLCPAASNADMIVVVGDGTPLTFAPGDPASIPVFAYNSSTQLTGAEMLAWNLGFSIGASPGIPPWVTNFNASNFLSDWDGDLQPGGGGNFDFLVSAFGSQTPLPESLGSALRLFDLTFTIDPTAPFGTVPLQFVPEAEDQFGQPANAVAWHDPMFENLGFGAEIGPNYGEFQVVPEPTSFVMLSLAGLGGYAWRRRRGATKLASEAVAA